MRTPYLFPGGAALGVDNTILHARARSHRVENYAGPLSIKTVVSGEVSWVVGGRELTVDRSSFLILSAGERYSMRIDTREPVETCCAFFAPGFVERIAQDLTSPLSNSLDDPDRAAPSMPYLSALHDDREVGLTRQMQGLATRCHGLPAPSSFEEDFLTLASGLLRFYEQIRAQAAQLPAAKASTRQELFQRLLRGRDYLHANLSEPVSLTGVARAAHLSPFHFHRGFKTAFGLTPHAYLTRLRLARARRRIETGVPVFEACMEAGFSSPSSFTKLFRAQFGVVPSAIRHRRDPDHGELTMNMLEPIENIKQFRYPE